GNDPGANNTVIANTFYSNKDAILIQRGATGNVCVACNIGYSTAGVSNPETDYEVFPDANSTGNGLVLKNSLLNPSPGIRIAGFTSTGTYVVNYSTNSGVVQVYGDYQVSGSTFSLDFVANLYSSSATVVRVVTGSEADSGFVVSALS